MLSYLFLLFFGTLHSNGYIFPFLLCLSLLSFSQLFVRRPQTTILPFCISFSWGQSWSLPSVQCRKPPSIVLQALCPITSGPITSWQMSHHFMARRWGNNGNSERLFLGALKSLQMVTAAMKLKDACSLKEKL